MVRTVENFDRDCAIELSPFQHDLDSPSYNYVDGVDKIKLSLEETNLFLDWISESSWREKIEEDLQSIAQDENGTALVTTWLPLVTFRESLCGGGRQLQHKPMQDLMEKLRALTREWRGHQVDTVDISGALLEVKACV